MSGLPLKSPPCHVEIVELVDGPITSELNLPVLAQCQGRVHVGEDIDKVCSDLMDQPNFSVRTNLFIHSPDGDPDVADDILDQIYHMRAQVGQVDVYIPSLAGDVASFFFHFATRSPGARFVLPRTRVNANGYYGERQVLTGRDCKRLNIAQVCRSSQEMEKRFLQRTAWRYFYGDPVRKFFASFE